MLQIHTTADGTIQLKNDNEILVPIITNERVAGFTLEYYQNKLNGVDKIELEKTITDNTIKITSDSTMFINVMLHDYIQPSQLIGKLRACSKALRERGIKQKGYSKVLNMVKENATQYEMHYHEQVRLFNELKSEWLTYELHTGYGCDYGYDMLTEKRYKLEKAQKALQAFEKLNNKIENMKYDYDCVVW